MPYGWSSTAKISSAPESTSRCATTSPIGHVRARMLPTMQRDPGSRQQRSVGRCVALAIVALVLLSACSSAPATSATGTPSSDGSAVDVPTVESRPSPEVTSTTEPAESAPAGAISVELAGPPPHFVPADLTATAGDVVFYLHNSSEGTHTLAIGPELYTLLIASTPVSKGDSVVLTVHGLAASDYVIWCTIDGHAAEGMVGSLTVS